MSDGNPDIPVVADLPSLPMFGISREGLTVRVGARSYIFERSPETGGWQYVSNTLTVFPDEDTLEAE